MSATTIIRPNGKPYRPRAGLRAYGWDDDDRGESGVMVLGTNDTDAAREFALRVCRSWYGTKAVELQATGWFRDGFLCGQRTFIVDPERGRPGVSFVAVDA